MAIFKFRADNTASPPSSTPLVNNVLYDTTVFSAEPVNGDGIIDTISQFQLFGNEIIKNTYLYQKIPFCILKEYDLVTNSTASQLLYYLKSIGLNNTATAVTDSVTNISEYVQKLIPNSARQFGANVSNSIKDTVGNFVDLNNLSNISDKIFQPIGEILKQNEPFTGSLTPYQNLYIRKPTNFKYILPYYNDNKKSITTNFADSQTGLLQGSLFQKASEGIKGMYEMVAKNLLAAAPGAYIEQPKFFSPASGESFNIQFNLINTVDGTKIQDHFDFLFLLAFQNLPYRRDIATVALPKIYTFIIPGEIYLPYAYISNMTIDFIGNRRILNLIHPKTTIGGDTSPTKCIVPDVYKVNITVTSLTTNAANFMIADELFKIDNTIDNPLLEVTPRDPANESLPRYRSSNQQQLPPEPLPTPSTPPSAPIIPLINIPTIPLT